MKRFGASSRDEQQQFLEFGDRIMDGDSTPPTDDLESTFLTVQRVMRSRATASSTMPDHLKTRTWEDIVQNTAAASPAMRSSSADQRHRIRTPGSGRLYRPAQLPRMGWSSMANVALALLIVVAGFGAWRAFDGGLGDGGNGPAPSGGNYAFAPTTPVPVATAEVADVVEPISACDVSGNVPIVKDLAADALPFTGTLIYTVRYDVTGQDRRADLLIGCEGEESTLLASDVIDVAPGPWQGTVFVSTLPEDTEDLAEQQTTYVSFITGKSVTFGRPATEMQTTSHIAEGSPWVIGSDENDPSQLVIVDLRTMEPRPLSDVAGGVIPSESMVIISTPAADGTIALGFAHPYSADAGGGTLMADTGMPGDVLLLGESFNDASWIDVPDSLKGVQSIMISPDGSHAAVASMSRDGNVIGDSYSYAVIDLEDGALIGQTDSIPFMDNPFVAWVQDGTAIAYTAENTLQTLSVDGNGSPETAFEAEQLVSSLNTTWDENVVTVTTREDHGSDADPNSTDIDMVYSVNLNTGVVHEFAGMDASASIGWISDAGALVMYDWEDTTPETTDYRVFDPVTGEQLGTIEDAPSVQVSARTLPTIGRNSVSISKDGTVEVIALGTQHIYAFVAGDNGMSMQQIESPEGLLSEIFLTGNVYVSPDGSMLALNGEEDEGRVHYLIALDDPDAKWQSYMPETVGERGRNLLDFARGMD